MVEAGFSGKHGSGNDGSAEKRIYRCHRILRMSDFHDLEPCFLVQVSDLPDLVQIPFRLGDDAIQEKRDPPVPVSGIGNMKKAVIIFGSVSFKNSDI